MIIQSLEEMEKIVSNSKHLKWDGWSVVSLKPIDSGMVSKDGILIDGSWYIQRVFDPTEKGWEIPNKIVE